jgi:DHA1 family multidrug resistance protein-like MFS transporter
LIFIRQPGYQRKLAANNNVPIPEWRLPEVIVGGIAFSAGIFWFGWTGYRQDIHWSTFFLLLQAYPTLHSRVYADFLPPNLVVPTLSGILIGFGLLSIFLQALNYLVDAYLMFAASAIAANTFLRSLCGAAFPLFARQMFEGMGIQWAATLLGIIAALLVPVPIWFYLRGAKIREKSAFAPTGPKPSAPMESGGDQADRRTQ